MINNGVNTQFTTSENNVEQNSPELLKMECDAKKRRYIDSAVIILSDDNDNVYQETNPVATPNNILHSGTLTGSSLMEQAITKLRTLTDRNTYLIEPNTVLLTLNFNVQWLNITAQTKSISPEASRPIYFFNLMFSGRHLCGHFFCIIAESNLTRTLYCIDTLPESPEKRALINNFLKKIGYHSIEILHASCIPQSKLECGPRTTVLIHDIVDQIRNGTSLRDVLRILNTYNILSHAYASHARSWLF